MARSDFIKNELVSEFTSHATWASMHSTNPGTTGAGEIVTVDRQPITWTDAGLGKVRSNPMIFTVPAGTTVAHIGMWSAETGGNYVDSITHSADFPDAQTYRIILTYTQT